MLGHGKERALVHGAQNDSFFIQSVYRIIYRKAEMVNEDHRSVTR